MPYREGGAVIEGRNHVAVRLRHPYPPQSGLQANAVDFFKGLFSIQQHHKKGGAGHFKKFAYLSCNVDGVARGQPMSAAELPATDAAA